MSLITVVEAKEILQIGHDETDALVQTLIDGAENFVENWLGILLVKATLTEYLAAKGNRFNLWPKCGPILSVSEILDTEDSDTEIVLTTLRVMSSRIALEDGDQWNVGENRYKVTYEAGYEDVSRPKGLKGLVLQFIFRAYHGRGGKRRQSAEGYGYEFEKLMASDLGDQLELYSLRTHIG